MMRLPCGADNLSYLGPAHVLTAIRERRTAIRQHRDQKGDDRCWVDDYALWAMLEGLPPIPIFPPPIAVAMIVCRMFYQYRNSDAAPVIPENAILDPAHWDDDLIDAHPEQLLEKLIYLQDGILTWSLVMGSAENDQWLYNHLPEKLPADFRLPPENEFLGEAGAPKSGCPSFWRSHSHCGRAGCDLTRWGPCGNPEVQ